jgi:hypothetical protein
VTANVELFSEADLVLPTLRELARLPDRWVPIDELADQLILVMETPGDDAGVLEARTRILQMVRNMVTQKTAEENIIRAGYAVFIDNSLKITENGLAFLKRKLG